MIVSSLDIFQMAGRRSTSQTKSRRTIAVKWTIILAAPFLGKEYETLRKPYVTMFQQIGRATSRTYSEVSILNLTSIISNPRGTILWDLFLPTV